MDKTILNTIKVVLTTFTIILAIFIIYTLAPVFVTLFVALFLVISLEPMVRFFMAQTVLNKNMTRGLATTLTYLTLIAGIMLILTAGLPPVWGQTQKLLANAGNIVAGIPLLSDLKISTAEILPSVNKVTDKVLDSTFSLFSTLSTAVTILILSIYASLDWENLKNNLYSLFAGKTRNMVVDIVTEIERDIGYWVKGQLGLMVFIGFFSFLASLIIGLDYPLALGMVAGLLEIIPILGPLVSMVIAGVIGFSISPAKGLLAMFLFWLINQLEASFLVPKVMSKVSGFSPIIVLLALLVAGTFFGILGAITAIPLTMIIVVIIRKILSEFFTQ